MNSNRHQRLSELFGRLIELEDDQRTTELRRIGEDDPALRDELEALLAKHDDTEGRAYLDSPALGGGFRLGELATELDADGTLVGRTIGHYTLQRVIATGGMGTVYVAMQEHPHRKVALKIMKRGIASRSALRRFELESQTLSRLKHPNVAQVYDAGTHDDGSGGVPYFAMEYIPAARSLTEYAAEKKLGTRERLDLFAKVCDAVHHGHQKGIIHRDLKPGNILVDTNGEPKIIDFGVARSTDSDLAVTTLQTGIGQLIGTLQYMSPEQCAADPDDIDTRSDVYALGVVLYELLCERVPYDISRAAIHEAARMIREDPPTKPSTIDRTLRGDVETIALKALEKERERRYRSAEALADDVRHYLRSEPIQARRASLGYQLSRFARRHRELVGAAVLLFALLVAGIVVTSVLLVRSVRVEAAAQEQKTRADEEAVAANEARARADEEAAAALQEKERADAALKRVLSLADVKLVGDYAAEVDDLWPAHPERIEALEAWLAKARDLGDRLPAHEAELARLREGAIPLTPEEAAADRASHPRLAKLETETGRLAWLRLTLTVREGANVEPAPEPDWANLPGEAEALAAAAAPLVDPDRTTFGDESRALAIARRAAELAPQNSEVLETLARALLANGLDAEAGATAAQALAAAPEDEREEREESLADLREAVAANAGPDGLACLRTRIDEVAAEVGNLDEEVSARRTWRFADTSAQWQHDVLEELVTKLLAFGTPETGAVADVESRLAFARGIEDRTTGGPDVRRAWSAAIASIADRDACPLYEGLVMTPQLGLVPLDRNPGTGLWEFWHVQTGARPEANPDWPEDAVNRWRITGDTGLVFVLVPGGTFRMGAEPLRLGVDAAETPEGLAVTAVNDGTLAERMKVEVGDVLRTVNGAAVADGAALADTLRTVTSGAAVTAAVLRGGAEVELTATAARGVDSPNVDPDAERDEAPVHDVTLDPFFLSKYEMTQGQWTRFVGENPSLYSARRSAWDQEITDVHPVERVSWNDVERTAARLGVALPTEAQWEYACRAGTTSIWNTGGQPASLLGCSNLPGQECAPYIAGWALEEDRDDGFVLHAPAGSFRSNGFGLHDAHGNVWEWCRDRDVDYGTAPRTGDGMRDDPSVSYRVARGGGFNGPPILARSADRFRVAPTPRSFVQGVRPSRVITE